MAEVKYTDDNIRTIEGVEHIRLRPGMYIGRLGNGSDENDGIYVLQWYVCCRRYILLLPY